MGKFQSLCTVQRHQKHSVLLLIHVINIRNKCDFFQEAGKCRFLMLRLIGNNLGKEFVHVFHTAFRFFLLSLCLQQIHIARCIDDILQKLFQPVNSQTASEYLYHIDKRCNLGCTFAKCRDLFRLPQCIIKTQIIFVCIILYLCDRCRTDPTLRDIDDTFYRHIIASVIDRL